MTTHFSILCLENSTDRILAGYSSWGSKELDMTEHTGMHTCRHALGAEKMNSTIWSYYGTLSFSGGSDGKEFAYNAEDPGLIPRLERCPGEGNGNALQYSCLENPMDRRAW